VLQLIHCPSVICSDRLFWRAASSICRRHPDVHCSLKGRPQREHRHTRKVYLCCTSVQWLLHNGLQLNPSKSEAILFTTGRGRQSVDDAPSLQVSDAVIEPSATIKSLVVTLDRHLTLDQHVADLCKACSSHTLAAPCAPVSSWPELLPAAYSARGSTTATHCLLA